LGVRLRRSVVGRSNEFAIGVAGAVAALTPELVTTAAITPWAFGGRFESSCGRPIERNEQQRTSHCRIESSALGISVIVSGLLIFFTYRRKKREAVSSIRSFARQFCDRVCFNIFLMLS
jgi:hypothetical protein